MVDSTIIVDNDLASFARDQLLAGAAKVTSKSYPSLKYKNLMPVINLTGMEFKTSFEVLEWDVFGIATVLADGGNDGGLVGVVARRQRYPIKTISDYTLVSWETIMQCQEEGIPLNSMYGAALVFGVEKKNNSIAFDGDPDYGLQGLFTSQLPRLNALTTFAGAASPQARLDILNNAVTTVSVNCQNMWLPKVLAMPNRQYQLLNNDVYSTVTGKTTMTVFKENQAAMGLVEEIIIDDLLVGKGENGTDAMLVLPGSTPGMSQNTVNPLDINETGIQNAPIYYGIARDFDVPEEFSQWTDTMYRERGVARVCGCVVEDPRTGLIVSNI